MSKEKTKTTSLGEKTKKFKMPKFPSALVVLFIVLLFVVLLSWIPHKGWVDTANPFLLVKDGYIYGPDGTPWGVITNVKVDSKTINEISFSLTSEGASALSKCLINYGISWANIELISAASMEKNAFTISNIKTGDDWNQVAITYSSLTFDLTFNNVSDDSKLLLPNSWEMTVNIDQIFQNSSIVMENGEVVEGNFAILSGTIDIPIGGKEEITQIGFASANEAQNWFNFWHTNYYVGDQAGRYGILNIPFILLAGLFNASGVILYLLCIGAFIEIMLQSGALEAGTSSLVKKLDGKELLLIPTLFLLFCFSGSSFGLQEETLGLIPLIIPFLILAGFDTMTGLLIVVIGTASGIASSVLDPFSVGVMSGALETAGPDTQVALSDGIVIRIIMFIGFVIAGSLFCTWYGHRSRRGKDFVAEPEMYEKNKKWAQEMLGESHASHEGLTKRQSIGLIIFGIVFVIMIFALLPWTTWFGGYLETANWWSVLSSLFFAKVLFGQWYFIQLSFLFLVTGLILGRVFGMEQKKTNKAVITGMKGMIGVCLILMISRSVALVLTYSGLSLAMIAMMFQGEGDGSFGPFGLAWVLFPMFAFLAVFIPSTSGLAGITGPLIAPIIWQLSDNSNELFLVYGTVVMTTYPLGQGVINMFMPTTGLVVAQAEVSRVNFGKAFKILGIAALGTAIIGMVIISASIPIMMAGL